MAQTKRKRRTKHRGNAAGVVEVRGRTGRKLTEADRRATGKPGPQDKRAARLDRPPSWQASIQRAGIAAALFAAVLLLFFRDQSVGAVIALAGFMFLLYIPMGFYTDQFVYNRRQKAKLKAGGKR